MNILIVDDNQNVAEALVKLLSKMGHTAHSAYSGKAALNSPPEPDFAFLDMDLGDMSGFELALKMKKEGKFARTKLVALTGSNGPESVNRASRSGFAGYLVKPVGVAELNRLFNDEAEKVI